MYVWEGFRWLIMCLFYQEYILPRICSAFEYKPCLKEQFLSVRYLGNEYSRTAVLKKYDYIWKLRRHS